MATGFEGTKWWGRLAGAALLVAATGACWEPNPFFVDLGGDGSSTGQGTASTTGIPTTSGVDASGSTAVMTSDATGATTTSDSTTTGGGTTTTGGSSGSESSSGGVTPPSYPPCMPGSDPVCPDPYTECYPHAEPDHSFCTYDCQDDGDCPEPSGGTAVSICAPMISQCALDCAGGATCPAGMDCIQVGPANMYDRCAWPN